jgi:diguanylate cyclase (GGDEF)-like protein
MSGFLKIPAHRKISLQVILVVPFLLQIGAVVGLTGWVSLRNGHQAVNDLANQLRTEASNRIALQLDDYLSTPRRLVQVNVEAIEIGQFNPSHLDVLGRFFGRQLQVHPNIGRISFGATTGEYVAAERPFNHDAVTINRLSPQQFGDKRLYVYQTDSNGYQTGVPQAKRPYFFHKQTWYAEAARSGRLLWSQIEPRRMDLDILSISVSSPVYDANQRLLGVLAIEQQLSQVSEFLRQSKVSPSGKTFILERKGLLVASSSYDAFPSPLINGRAQRLKGADSPDPVVQMTTRLLLQKFGGLHKIQTEQPLEFQFNNVRQFVRVTPWQDSFGLKWLIVVVVPESDFMETINTNTRTTTLFCLVALISAAWMSLYTSRRLVQMILQVVQAADALSQGEWNLKIPEPYSSELTLLARAFNRMASHLRGSFMTLEYNACHDALTGLLNQAAFRSRLEAAIARRSLYDNNPEDPIGYRFAVLFIDLDYFKLVNDSFGHLMGDQLLIQVSNRLEGCVRNTDVLARFGGDEFVILLDSIAEVTDAIQIADRISVELRQPFLLDHNEVFISTSIGIVLSTTGGDSPESFLQNADIALYQAKANGKSTYEVFNAHMHTGVMERMNLETDLRRGFEREEFELYYQPTIDITTYQITGFEALVRWHHPTQGMIAPARFIPIAEETGLIVPLGEWVLRQACQQMRRWQAQFEQTHQMSVSVNLSIKQFLQPDLLEKIETILAETQLPAASLKLEITESLCMSQGEVTRAKLKRLREAGIQLSIDDFGTGYSSLSYLQRFPINTLKIDRSFIHRLGNKGENLAIVEAITVMAHKLGMDVVAEGVETMEQLEKLRDVSCEQIQGYLFSPPVAADQATELLKRGSEHQHLQTQQQLSTPHG